MNKIAVEESVLRLNDRNEERDQFTIVDDESGISFNMSFGIVQFMISKETISAIQNPSKEHLAKMLTLLIKLCPTVAETEMRIS
jgi:hypothetical protein